MPADQFRCVVSFRNAVQRGTLRKPDPSLTPPGYSYLVERQLTAYMLQTGAKRWPWATCKGCGSGRG